MWREKCELLVGGVALGAVIGMGAVGGILANIALTPLTAGASLLQSYWYGAGLILGERMMYTVHWEKIKARLDKGETFMNVLDSEMNKDITAIAELSFKAMDETGNLFLKTGTANLGKFIEELLAAAINPFFSGDRETDETQPSPDEPIDQLTSVSISEIQSWTDTLLKFNHSPNNILKFTEASRLHIKTEYEKRFGATPIVENEPVFEDVPKPNTDAEIIAAARAYVGKALPQDVHLGANWVLYIKQPSGGWAANNSHSSRDVVFGWADAFFPSDKYDVYIIGINYYYVNNVIFVGTTPV